MKKKYIAPSVETVLFRLSADILGNSIETAGQDVTGDLTDPGSGTTPITPDPGDFSW